MRLIAIPLDRESLIDSGPHWVPFVRRIAARTREPADTLIKRVLSKEIRLILVWDDTTNSTKAMIGIRLHMRGPDLIGEILWATGTDRKAWQQLLPELEQMLRDAGCAESRPLCRPGWSKFLQSHGYRITHIQMEKVL
jgi:hypothetical protein